MATAMRMNWQPIETAPDHQRVLVCRHDDRVEIAMSIAHSWYDDAGRMINQPRAWAPLPGPEPKAPAKPPAKRAKSARPGRRPRPRKRSG
jgi:hypothetical protein